jgi:hypothetical protein
MSTDRPNRIEVDLRLLQDENLKLLREFSDKFTKAVEDLDAIARRGFGIKEGGPFADAKEHASTPQAVQEMVSGPIVLAGLTGRTLRENLPLNVDVSRPERFESRAPTPEELARGRWDPEQLRQLGTIISSSYAALPGPYGGNEWERAQFALGQLQPGLISGLQYASFLLGQHGASFEDPTMWRRDAQGNLQYMGTGGRLLAARLSGGLGGAARLGIYGQKMFGQLSQFLPFMPAILPYPAIMNQMALTGIGVGNYDTGGWLGTPWFSPAWRRGVGQQIQAWSRSRWGGEGLTWKPWLGFGLLPDPNYSRAQALEAQNLMTQFGWGGDLRDAGLDLMERYTRRYRGAISQDLIMQMIDPIMRYGMGSIGQVSTTLNALAQSAKAANMNLQVFAEQALEAGKAINAQTGMPLYRATRAAANIMGITGMSSQAATEIMTNETYLWLASAQSGRSIGSLAYDSSSASLRTKAMLDFAGSGPGALGNPESWRGYKWDREVKDQSPQHQALIDQFFFMKQAGVIPQNIDLSQWLNMMRRALTTGKSPVMGIEAAAIVDEGIDSSSRIKDKTRAYTPIGQAMEEAGFGKVWKAARRLAQLGYDLDDPTKFDKERKAAKRFAQFGFDFDYPTSYLLHASEEERREVQRLMKIVKPYQDLIKERGGSIDTLEDAQAFAKGVIEKEWGTAGDQIAREGIEISIKQPYDEIFEALIKKTNNARSGNSSPWFARRANSP